MVTENTPFVPVLHVEDRLPVGKKVRRHAEAGDALTHEDWLSLPGSLAEMEWYKDVETGNLVAYRADGVAIGFSPDGKADHAYRDAAAPDKIKRGVWVRGRQ